MNQRSGVEPSRGGAQQAALVRTAGAATLVGGGALEPGMLLSNEPGYYREGAFGIRIENLVLVRDAPPIDGADDRDMLAFETLTLAPIDRRLIRTEMLDAGERAWLDAYHLQVRAALGPRVSTSTRAWLDTATAPL